MGVWVCGCVGSCVRASEGARPKELALPGIEKSSIWLFSNTPCAMHACMYACVVYCVATGSVAVLRWVALRWVTRQRCITVAELKLHCHACCVAYCRIALRRVVLHRSVLCRML